MRSALLFGLAVGVLAGTAVGCDTGFPAGREPHHELNFLDMADQPKLKPQRKHPWRVEAPYGAVSTDYRPYPYGADQGDWAGLRLHSPLERDAQNLAHGKFVYDNVCLVCHGAEGAGDGEVSKLFPKPPSLMTERVRTWPDGRIFHVPMRGQASMPSYAKQLSQEDIWAVVMHVRELQSKLPVAPADPTRPSTPPLTEQMLDGGVDGGVDGAAEDADGGAGGGEPDGGDESADAAAGAAGGLPAEPSEPQGTAAPRETGAPSEPPMPAGPPESTATPAPTAPSKEAQP